MTLLAFIGALVLLVVFHEFGHYWVARRCGVKVLRFSLGFGKVLYQKRFAANGTEWVISAIPLGGYVKMLDEREGDVAEADLPYAFNRQSVLRRMAIVVAGPLANFLLAIVLYWGLFLHGVPGLKPLLGEIPSGTPAAYAQMQAGEMILTVNGEAIPSWQELRWRLLDLAMQRSEVRIEGQTESGIRQTHLLDLSVLQANDLEGEFLDKLGLQLYQPKILPILGKLVEAGVAQQASLREGDIILQANGQVMPTWHDWVRVVRAHPAQSVLLLVQRGSSTFELNLVPQAVSESGLSIGKIGAAPQVDEAAWQAIMTTLRYNPMDALFQALRKTWETSTISLKMMGKMLLGEVSLKNLSGPITIADYAGQSAGMGMVAYLGFLALISISLGVLNLLPIPLLDGGHLLYYAAELLKGSPVSEKGWEIGQNIGIALLGTLMVFALYNDITRLITG